MCFVRKPIFDVGVLIKRDALWKNSLTQSRGVGHRNSPSNIMSAIQVAGK